MKTGEKWLFKVLLGEAFDPAARAILSVVSGLPGWAATSPFEASSEADREVA